MKKKVRILLIALAIVALPAAGQPVANHYVASPLVFERYQRSGVPAESPSKPAYGLQRDDAWLERALSERERQNAQRYELMISHPELVKYNANLLPVVPRDVNVVANPSGHKLAVVDSVKPAPVEAPVQRRDIKVRNWIHSVDGSLHFTQSYISGNWYQGGENYLSLLGHFKWECNLNTNVHPKWLFNNMVQYKIGVSTSHNDSLRKYTINEDIFELSSNAGYKAVKHWYYSANLMFKTQFFQNFKSNTTDMKASFLSPGELTFGLGMTYNYKDKEGIKSVTVAISPLSYNMKICRDIERLDPTTFGIDAGRHVKHSFGSSLEGKFLWKITPNIEWLSRLYFFTDYHYVQGDWENSFSFAINRYLSTKIFVHLRYDNSHTWDSDWRYWQLKEILSFGLTYHFATK